MGFLPPDPPNPLYAALGAALSNASSSSSPFGNPTLLGGNALTTGNSQWIYVERRFNTFLSNILLTDEQLSDGNTKIKNVVKCLNKHYWGIESDTLHYMLGGSWGKHTRVRPPRDIDLIFFLPVEVYNRYQLRTGNIQSQLLQEVKNVLTVTYPNTTMRGDGQVVMVGFNSFMVEVVPAFELQNGQVWICNTKQEGCYKTIDPVQENKSFDAADKQWNRNARDLVRMLKAWQEFCDVPIRSFIFERLALEFLSKWQHSGRNAFWYDWMVRDYFAFMLTRANGSLVMPGTGEIVLIGNAWVSKANSAYSAAYAACGYETINSDALAAAEWQKNFGNYITRMT